MSNAISRPIGAVTDAGTPGNCVPCVPCGVEIRQSASWCGVLGLLYPKQSLYPWLPSSSRTVPQKMRSKWLGARGFCLRGRGLRDAGWWPSQVAVAKVRVALVYSTRFHWELRALSGLVATGSGEPQAHATPSQNGLRWCRAAALALNMSWIIDGTLSPWMGNPETCGPILLEWG
jgi:hypothetical protein